MNVTNTFRVELVIGFDFLAALGILFAIACLLFNIIFRKKKYKVMNLATYIIIVCKSDYNTPLLLCRALKVTSPKLNYFIIAGAILMYISIGFYLMPTKSEDLSLARCMVCTVVGNITL